jgi:putative transcriptional regulator
MHVKEALRYKLLASERKTMKNNIVQIRQERGIKQDELAKGLGGSRQTISSLENGRYDPSILLAHKIAKLFGLSIEEVFLFEEEEK